MQILFRQSMPSNGMVILRNEDIKWLVMRVNSGFFTVKKAAQVCGVTERLVKQLIKKHRDTGEIPRLSPNRRPKTSLSADQKAVIEKAWKRRVWAHDSSFTNCDGAANTYHTTRSTSIFARLEEACRIPENRSKGSGVDTNVSIRVIWYTATGIGRR